MERVVRSRRGRRRPLLRMRQLDGGHLLVQAGSVLRAARTRADGGRHRPRGRSDPGVFFDEDEERPTTETPSTFASAPRLRRAASASACANLMAAISSFRRAARACGRRHAAKTFRASPRARRRRAQPPPPRRRSLVRHLQHLVLAPAATFPRGRGHGPRLRPRGRDPRRGKEASPSGPQIGARRRRRRRPGRHGTGRRRRRR